MDKPILLVIAGCNGSGKSSFSKALVNQEQEAYDYDKVYLQKYNSLIPNELQDKMAHNLADEDFRNLIAKSIDKQKDFAYETNFNSTPLFWPKKFKEAGFKIEIVFFCLDSIEKAKQRVLIRFENGGHFVPDHEVKERYQLGYKYLNEHLEYFDTVRLFETSIHNETPKHLLTIENNEVIVLDGFPEYLQEKLPNVSAMVKLK